MTKARTESERELQRKNEPELPSKERYDAFIAGLKLLDVRLIDSSARALVRRADPGETEVSLSFGVKLARDEEHPERFEVVTNLDASFVRRKAEGQAGFINTTLGLLYQSDEPIDDELFGVFQNLNVPINAWPYLREYVHQTVMRFGWPPFILPPYKTVSSEKHVRTKDDEG